MTSPIDFNALLIGYARNATPPDYAARDAYVESETEYRANGPWSGDEINFNWDELRQTRLERLMAAAIQAGDDAELGRIVRTELSKHRAKYYEHEVECELQKLGR